MAMESPAIRSSIYKRALEITWLAAIFLIPLYFNPLSHNIFHLGKTLLLEFLVMSMLGLWVADWMLNRTGSRGLKWQDIFNSPLHISILVFGLIAVLSTVASITPAVSFWGSYFRKAGLLKLICWILFFLIVAHRLRSRAQLLRAVYTLLLSSGIVSLLGILQHFLPDVISNLFRSPYTFNGRVSSTVGNPLFLSSFLTMVIPLNLALIIYSWRQRKEGHTKILAGLVILLALQFWCLWLAQYSITILLYIIAPVVFILLLGIMKRNRLIISLGVVSMLLLAIIAGSLLVPLISSTPTVETIEPEETESISSAQDLELKTLGWRVQYWRGTIDLFLKSPEVPFSNDKLHFLRKLIGYGPETFTFTFQLFFPEKLRSRYTYTSLFVDRPHNDYLYLATTMGLLGLMSFLSILAVFFYLCFKYLSRATTDIDKLLLVAIVAGIVQYMADIFFNLSTISPELVFWLMLAMTCTIGRFVQNKKTAMAETEQRKRTESSAAPHVTRARSLVSLICALALIIVGIGITIRPFLADIYFLKGLNMQGANNEEAIYTFEKATRLDPGESVYWHRLGVYSDLVARRIKDSPLKLEVLSVAYTGYNKALALTPYMSYEYYFLADVNTYWTWTGTVDKWATTLSLYDEAAKLSPDNAVILNKWALALILKGDLDEARTKLDQSASADPDWAETSFLSGLLLALEGEHDEAASALTAPIYDDSANLTYFIKLYRRLYIYDMIGPVRDALEIHIQKAPDDWVSHALSGTINVFSGYIDKSLYEFDIAMMLVPENDAGNLFRNILRLSGMSKPLITELPDVAAKWRDKVAQSPEADTLLPMLDQLVGNTE